MYAKSEKARPDSRAFSKERKGEKSKLLSGLILKGVIALLAGTDLDDVLHVGDEDLAVAEVAGVGTSRVVFTTRETGSLLTTMDTCRLGSMVASTLAPRK